MFEEFFGRNMASCGWSNELIASTKGSFSSKQSHLGDLFANIISLLISLCLVIGSFLIRRILNSFISFLFVGSIQSLGLSSFILLLLISILHKLGVGRVLFLAWSSMRIHWAFLHHCGFLVDWNRTVFERFLTRFVVLFELSCCLII